ncbi:MAG: hypothetical protein HY303_08750 [Candidatus Wallbacteria bacterium]|nr:hypothetical protein [Candidatus Wallbacteria bacterium]
MTPCRSRRGSLAVLLVLLTLLALLGLTFLSRTSGERQLTAQLLAHERSQCVAEAAIAEAFWTVQKTMNTTGSAWFAAMRQPSSSSVPTQTFVPARAARLLEELAGAGPPVPKVDVELRFLGAAPLAGLAADPAEKTGYLQASAAVTIGSVKRVHRLVREVRVARTAPAAPLDAFSFWICAGPGAGALRGPGGLPGTPPGPHDAAVKLALEQSWKYSWGGQRARFPFARARVSEYYPDWKTFLDRRTDASRTILLSGVVLVADTADATLSGVRLAGNGALWVTDCSLKLAAVAVAKGDLPQLAVLGPGKKLELTGYLPGSVFRGSLAVPEGTLVTEADLTIEGSVLADRWSIPPNTTLRHSRAADPFLVTLSEATYAP